MLSLEDVGGQIEVLVAAYALQPWPAEFAAENDETGNRSLILDASCDGTVRVDAVEGSDDLLLVDAWNETGGVGAQSSASAGAANAATLTTQAQTVLALANWRSLGVLKVDVEHPGGAVEWTFSPVDPAFQRMEQPGAGSWSIQTSHAAQDEARYLVGLFGLDPASGLDAFA